MRHLLVMTCLTLGLSAFGGGSAEAVVADYVKALGGAQKLASVKSMKLSGIYVYNGIEHPLTIYKQDGDKVRMDIGGLERFGQKRADHVVVRSLSGAAGWGRGEARDDYDKVYDLGEADAFMLSCEAPFFGSAAEQGHQVKLVGDDKVDGTPVHHLEITRKDGKVEHWYMSKKTALPVKVAVNQDANERFKPASWFFDDWRKVNGLNVPHLVVYEEWLFAREHVLESVELNPELDAAVFQKPQG